MFDFKLIKLTQVAIVLPLMQPCTVAFVQIATMGSTNNNMVYLSNTKKSVTKTFVFVKLRKIVLSMPDKVRTSRICFAMLISEG